MPVPIQNPATFSDAMAIAIANGHIKNAYEVAKVYDRIMESGDVEKIRSLDFSAELMCVQCQRPPLDTKTGKEKSMWCCEALKPPSLMVLLTFCYHITAGCKAVIYRSRDCQLKDWKTGHPSYKKPHKESCPAFKTQMGRVPQFLSVDSQFPWLRSESDGVFFADLFKARLNLLGSGPSSGWWSVRYEEQPHDHSEAELHKLRTSPGIAAALFEPSTRPATTIKRPAPGAYMHGEIMLGESWPTDVEGWKITEEWVPKLFFDENVSPPKAPLPGQVKDWESWYEWRGLSVESPAALLMDHPLSVYHLLVNVLKVVKTARLNERRSELVVHYLGAEIELNFLPLFSELALLLPNVHITLVIFGQPAHDLVHSAKKYHPSSIAAQDIVWSYKAPKRSGGGSIDIKLSSETVLWSRHRNSG